MISELMVLLVDRDRVNLSRMSEWLAAEGYRTSLAEDGLTALSQFFSLHPDMVVVDTDLPDVSGWDVIDRIRRTSDTPIVVISAEVGPDLVSRALGSGVQGFLLKPLDANELTLRVNAIRENQRDPDGSSWVYRRNGLVIDKRSCEVWVDGKPVDLTGTEYRLLVYMADRRGWVVSHSQILENVWGDSYTGDRNQVKLYMWYLRRKLERDPKNPKLIKTKRGLGYCFVG